MKLLYFILMAASLAALLLNRRQLDKRLHLLIPLLALALLPDGLKVLLGAGHWLRDFCFTIYTPIEFVIICVIYSRYIKNPAWRKVMRISAVIFVPLALYIQIWLRPAEGFYKYMDVLTASPLLCTFTLLLFFQLATENTESKVFMQPVFWVIVANLVYYSCSCFSYGFGSYLNHIKSDKEIVLRIYKFAKYANLVLYGLYLFAFSLPWIRKKS